jgi:hypothetical protein
MRSAPVIGRRIALGREKLAMIERIAFRAPYSTPRFAIRDFSTAKTRRDVVHSRVAF